MSNKVLQFPKKPTEESVPCSPSEDIIANLYALANILEDDTMELEDQYGNPTFFRPEVGIVFMVNREGQLLIQSNVYDRNLLEEIMEKILINIRTANELEQEETE